MIRKVGYVLISLCVLAAGCSQSADDQVSNAAEQAKTVEEVSHQAGQATKAALDAGNKVKENVGKAEDAGEAAVETGKIKSALGFAAGLDTSGIDVSTDLPTKTIKLSGTVPTDAQLDQANSLVKALAGTEFKVDSGLKVKSS